MKRAILALVGSLLWAAPAAQAQFVYTTNAGTIAITNYAGPGGALNIPSNIFGLPVTSIGNAAFFQCASLTSVTLPDSVASIGQEAFAGCAALTSAAIPESVTNIGESAFGSCSSLSTITVDALNSFYTSLNGVLFNHNQTTLIQYPGGLTGNYTIPDSATSIGPAAFQNCWKGLTSVTIPNGVVSIGQQAFEGCASLTNITIPSGVINLEDQAFANCPSLAEVILPNSVTSIGFQEFAGCGLASVTISNGVTSVGQQAFEGCASLTNITIPSSVTNRGQRALALCGSLSAITVDTANSFYSSLNGVLFNQGQTALLQYPGGLEGGYTIPYGVINIGDFAFAWCIQLTNVTIPNSVTSIGDDAFYGCASLTNITIPSSVTSIADNPAYSSTFYGCANLTSVFFQGNAPTAGLSEFSGDNNVTVYYLPGTTGWGAKFGGVAAVLLNPPVPAASLQITITPARAATAGAEWQVDGGPAQNSGAILPNLSVGRHTVSFSGVAGWAPPARRTVFLRAKSTTKANGAYLFSARGIYNGLFYSAGGVTEETAGMIRGLKVDSQGMYSGRLLAAGVSYPFTGFFDSSGQSTTHVGRAAKLGGRLALEMAFQWTNSPPNITGTVSGTNWIAALTADLAASGVGSAEYTILIAPGGPPPGYGYLLITNHTGNVTLSGALADGSIFSQSVPISRTADLPLYATLYGNTGLVLGWINLEGESPSGNVAWIKKQSRSTLYPGGFTNLLSIQGSRWITPPLHQAGMDLPLGLLEISGGNLSSSLNFNVALSNNNTLAKLPLDLTNSLIGAVNSKSGFLTVTFGNGLGKDTTRGKGALLQNATNAGGFFLGKTNAGAILLQR